MQDLILYIVKQLVTNPDAVSVEEHNENGEVNLLLTVDPVDMGLIIGKNGQTIKAIRKVLIVKAMADNVRVNLQLAEPEGGRPSRELEDPNIGKSEESADQQISESASAEASKDTSAEPADQPTSEEKPAKAKKSKKVKEEVKTAESESTETVENPVPNQDTIETEEETTP